MANDPEAVDRWVDERLRALEPGGDIRPDVARARRRLRQRQGGAPGGSRRAWLVAMATVVLVAVVLPWPRAAAQRLWDRLILGRVEIVRVDRPELPDNVARVFEMQEREPLQFEDVNSLAQAEQAAGFHVRLPASDLLAGQPQMFVIRKVTLATAPLNVDDINRSLAAAGISDVTMRPEWNGAALTVEGGPVIVARYQEAGIELMQTAPLKMTTPPEFRFDQFMEMAFRVFGRSTAEARDLAGKLAANPALLMVLRPGHHAVAHEIASQAGPVSIIGSTEGGMCAFWSAPGRMFIVSAMKMDEKLAAAIASSVGTQGALEN